MALQKMCLGDAVVKTKNELDSNLNRPGNFSELIYLSYLLRKRATEEQLNACNKIYGNLTILRNIGGNKELLNYGHNSVLEDEDIVKVIKEALSKGLEVPELLSEGREAHIELVNATIAYCNKLGYSGIGALDDATEELNNRREALNQDCVDKLEREYRTIEQEVVKSCLSENIANKYREAAKVIVDGHYDLEKCRSIIEGFNLDPRTINELLIQISVKYKNHKLFKDVEDAEYRLIAKALELLHTTREEINRGVYVRTKRPLLYLKLRSDLYKNDCKSNNLNLSILDLHMFNKLVEANPDKKEKLSKVFNVVKDSRFIPKCSIYKLYLEGKIDIDDLCLLLNYIYLTRYYTYSDNGLARVLKDFRGLDLKGINGSGTYYDYLANCMKLTYKSYADKLNKFELSSRVFVYVMRQLLDGKKVEDFEEVLYYTTKYDTVYDFLFMLNKEQELNLRKDIFKQISEYVKDLSIRLVSNLKLKDNSVEMAQFIYDLVVTSSDYTKERLTNFIRENGSKYELDRFEIMWKASQDELFMSEVKKSNAEAMAKQYVRMAQNAGLENISLKYTEIKPEFYQREDLISPFVDRLGNDFRGEPTRTQDQYEAELTFIKYIEDYTSVGLGDLKIAYRKHCGKEGKGVNKKELEHYVDYNIKTYFSKNRYEAFIWD